MLTQLFFSEETKIISEHVGHPSQKFQNEQGWYIALHNGKEKQAVPLNMHQIMLWSRDDRKDFVW